jgi:redox-sensing transcriptional repressor
LGQALANYTDFSKRGFILKGLFDINPKLIGLMINDVHVMDVDTMKEFIYIEDIDIGVICTSPRSAQEIADRLVESEIKGIWNFAPVDLKVPESVALENVHLSDSLLTLSYIIGEKRLAKKFQ